MTKTYVKDYTNTFEIKGETIEVTAPARFDSKTNKIIDFSKSEIDSSFFNKFLYQKLLKEIFGKFYWKKNPEK